MDDGYLHIGVLLRHAREERNISLDSASKQLHIRVRYLQALEEGRINDTPGVAYAKGYLHAYAGFLQLDKNEILRRFEQMEGALTRKSFFFPQVFSKEKKASSSAVYIGLIGAVVAYLLWAFMIKPEHLEISVIDTPVSKEERVKVSAALALDLACLKPSFILYPPCHRTRKQHTVLLPISRQYLTIMELDDLQN